MTELKDFSRLRPDDVRLDAATSERVWHAINGTNRDDLSAPSSEPSTNAGAVGFEEHRPSPRRRRYAVLGSVAVIMVGLAGFIAVQDRSRPAPQRSAGTPTAPADATGSDSSVPSTPDVVASPLPVDNISWQQATDTGSLARSQVFGLISGPGGFVATGMGFDDGKNQGRVWYSSDGLTWVEPALDVFDAKAVGYPASTSEAFYVVAQSNTDRLGLGEGAPSPNDAQLFRSVDGQNWVPWGVPWGESGSLASSGDVLLRQQSNGPLEWSADGLTWSPATFAEATGDGRILDLGPDGIIQGDGITYLRGFDREENFVIWSSIDGQRWQLVPTPPAGGSIAPVPGGLIVITDPRESECNATANSIFDASRPGSDGGSNVAALDDALQSQWECASPPDIYRFDETTGAWTLSANHPGDTPQVPPVVRLGNTLVAALIEPDKAMTAWTAPIDELAWTEQPATRLVFDDNTGSPGMAITAATTDRVIYVSPDRLVNGETAVVVGTIQPDAGS